MSQTKFVPHSDAAYRNTPKDKRTSAQQAYVDAQLQAAIERITRLYPHEEVFTAELATALAEQFAPAPTSAREADTNEEPVTHRLDVFR